MFVRLGWILRRKMRPRVAWMRPVDDWILECLESSGLVLSPRVIAHNIDYGRSYVGRRLQTLEANELVERVDTGFYRISDLGQKYLQGELSAEDLEPDAS